MRYGPIITLEKWVVWIGAEPTLTAKQYGSEVSDSKHTHIHTRTEKQMTMQPGGGYMNYYHLVEDTWTKHLVEDTWTTTLT